MSYEQSKFSEQFGHGFMLEKISALGPVDLENFKSGLTADCQDIFGGLSEEEQYIVLAIDRLSDQDLANLLENQVYQVGVHDLRNYLQVMYSVTLKSRYQK